MLNKIIRYFLEHRLVTALLISCFVLWGLINSPFNWKTGFLPSDPVPVDAIPNIGENQQIVFTSWQGRSPKDIEDQITYPLTTSLLGISGVKSIRSSSIFGMSSIYVIFDESVEFYWSRTRILEKLNSLPSHLLPDSVQPVLGPDATALGQVYWYTLEGRDRDNHPTGGWDLHELRSTQDFFVKYGLSSVNGVSEVASVGGYVKEYQINVNPDIMRRYNIPLERVIKAVKNSNKDVGAKTIEINKVEYFIRGIGYVKSVKDLEDAVITIHNDVPIRIKDISVVTLGPATRRGLLDKGGAEVVGGVVIARYGANPLHVINGIKAKIKDLSKGLPKKTLSDGTKSQLTIVPFYDRTHLIHETLATLEEALSLEVLISILVIIVMVFNLRASIVIAGLLPIAVLMVFISMRYFGVDANIVALSGIAIAIGTMVDLGVILLENIIRHQKESEQSHNKRSLFNIIYEASSEVGTAIVTAVATTVISFIPVFTMQASEGKLFRPLAFTKSFALVSALIVSLIILPTIAYWVLGMRVKGKTTQKALHLCLIIIGIPSLWVSSWLGIALISFGIAWFVKTYSSKTNWWTNNIALVVSLFVITGLLTKYWMPLGLGQTDFSNFIFVVLLLFMVLSFFILLERFYLKILDWCLEHKKIFLSIPIIVILLGITIWLGFSSTFGFVSKSFNKLGLNLEKTVLWSGGSKVFPGIGKEFMPSLNEGSFLLMPTSMPYAGFEKNKEVVQKLDMMISAIPEVDLAVGKMGRVDSALDPAPISMYENIINYKPKYILDENENEKRFKVDDNNRFILTTGDTLTNENIISLKMVDKLIPDISGNLFRNWRKKIRTSDDIWNEIVNHTKIPGVTSAPKLQPIETRLIMLQTGMRAPMGIKVFGPSLEVIEAFGIKLEKLLKEVPSVKEESVFADRIVGKPYIHLDIDRKAIARYGLSINDVQRTIETAIGGVEITSTVEGRGRFPVRVRYPRELRDNISAIKNVSLLTPLGNHITLGDVVTTRYVRGPQMIKSENTFLVGYVLFDKKQQYAETNVVEQAQRFLQQKIDRGKLIVPNGVTYKFSGSYENQIRAEKRLSVVIPLVLLLIFIILYFQFQSVSTTLMIFSGVTMAFSGAFLMLWLYGQPWFFNFSMFGVNMRTLFQIHTVNLSVAVWVGFIALFGIATDDGVLIGTYLDQTFKRKKPKTIEDVKSAVKASGHKRIKPAVMTSAITIIALLPVLTSQGKGSDIMIPMAIPSFGGMIVSCITFFITPVLYCIREERKIKKLGQ